MTRAMCTRTSKRKQTKPSEDVIEACKENSSCGPSISRSKEANTKKQLKICPSILKSKESLAGANNIKSSTSSPNQESSLRKSQRDHKSSFNNKDYVYNVPQGEIKSDVLVKRSVLSDKTNSPLTPGIKTFTQNKIAQETMNKNKNATSETNPCQLNESSTASKPHVPVYKALEPSEILRTACSIPHEKKEAVYEFDEVDENEEPVKKRKKKKITNTRKPRIGPKALTINNIKYSSTESLVSLPEKPVKQKKIKSRTPSLKSSSSVNNVNESDDTCYSVKSFMSHPPSLSLYHTRELKKPQELSILQETQSENIQSPIHEKINSLSNIENSLKLAANNHLHSNSLNMSTVFQNASRMSQNNSAVIQQRCYPSKRSNSVSNAHLTSQCDSVNDTLPNQPSQCSSNLSTGSSHEFLSSTPCKRTSMVVCHNSVFSDSFDKDIAIRVRPSTGFIKDAAEDMTTDDKYFGFDEPEELEEPLVSPIKNINLQEPRLFHIPRCELSFSNGVGNPKPDPKEIIEKLKATIPKTQNKKESDVYSSDSCSSDQSITSSPISKEVETTLNFIKPSRRSYERQRRVRYHSEHEGEHEDDEDDGDDEVKQGKNDECHHQGKRDRENVMKPAKKCYQKRNASKVFKAPHVPKAKQKILKEEEELEKLAAQMNAQFQEIEKCSLVVE